MKNQQTKSASKVSTSINNNNNKKGRPYQTELEKLSSNAVKDFIEHEDVLALFKNKNNIESKSAKEADLLREKTSKGLMVAANVRLIDQQIKELNANQCCNELIENKKRLISFLSREENKIDDLVVLPLGRPTTPLYLKVEKSRFKSTNSLKKLNDFESENNMHLTDINKLKQLADQRRDSNLGRKKKTKIENLDTSRNKSRNRIAQIEHNIANFSNEKKPGRKKDGQDKLKEEYLALSEIEKEISEIEQNMTEDQLFKRQIRQLKSIQNSLTRKRRYAKKINRKKMLEKKLLEIRKKILDKEYNFQLFKQKSEMKQSSIEQKNTDSVPALNFDTHQHKQAEFVENYNQLKGQLVKLLVENIELKSQALKLLLNYEPITKSA